VARPACRRPNAAVHPHPPLPILQRLIHVLDLHKLVVDGAQQREAGRQLSLYGACNKWML